MRHAALVVLAGLLFVVPAHAGTPSVKIECSMFEPQIDILLGKSGSTYQLGAYRTHPVNGSARVTRAYVDRAVPALLDVWLLMTQIPNTVEGGTATVIKEEKTTNDTALHTLACSFAHLGNSWMMTGQTVGADIKKTDPGSKASTMVLKRDQKTNADFVFLTAAWGEPVDSGSPVPVKMLFQH